jgi:enoyl-CoA hydratase/carnithine racemase
MDFEVKGHVAIMTLNRPEAMNSFNTELSEATSEGFRRVQTDRDIRVCIVTGAGERAFSAGADLKQMAERGAGASEGTFWDPPLPSLYRGLEIWKPIIAAINGYALGGGLELAMACDIRVAADHARLGVPEVLRGIIPGAGGTQRLPRLVPFGIALELLMTGRHIMADEAYRIGLVNHVVPMADLMDKSMEIANEIGKNGPLGVQAAKEAAYRGINTTLQEGLRIEAFEFKVVAATEDAKEGPRAFAEKREPNFQGR